VETRPGTPPVTPTTVAPSVAAGGRNTDVYKSSPKALKEPYSEQALRDVVRVTPPPADTVAMAAPATSAPTKIETKPEAPRGSTGDGDDDRLDWVWPAKGKVTGNFSETANLKGIDIAGAAGQPVFASAAGTVVYAGTGLRGYGKLIIIKHNKIYLSAYAHNRDILVKEGQPVTRGQKIAEMGNTDTSDVKLHFEIRRLGKPMDPTRYLPPA
jgi:lipoprotein NlpD